MPTSETTTHWSLKDLLSDPVDQAVEQYLTQLERSVQDLEALRPDLTPEISEEAFAKVLGLLESINSTMRRLQAYSFLWLSEDTQNEAALNLRDRLDHSLVSLGQPDFVLRDLVQGSAG